MSRRRLQPSPDLRRKPARREPKFSILIYSEGEVTEPDYFNRLADRFGNNLVRVEVVEKSGAPLAILRSARNAIRRIARSRDSFDKFDQVWAVFDCDDHPGIAQTLEEARAAGIKVAYSNPCFEVWLMLHHVDHDAPDDRWELQRKLNSKDAGYDPNGSKKASFEAIVGSLDDATRRAERMRARRVEQGDPLGRPYTNVDILAMLIVENGRS